MRRSNAYSLLVDKADEGEIRRAFDDETMHHLTLAMDGVAAELAPASIEALVLAIGPITTLLGQNWSRSGREEFISVVASELADYPGMMTIEALSRARRRVRNGADLLPWLIDDIEGRAMKLEAERSRLEALATIALQQP